MKSLMFYPGIENLAFVAVFVIVIVRQFRPNPLPLFWELFQCTAPKNQMAGEFLAAVPVHSSQKFHHIRIRVLLIQRHHLITIDGSIELQSNLYHSIQLQSIQLRSTTLQ
jgi:hypothetical protein